MTNRNRWLWSATFSGVAGLCLLAAWNTSLPGAPQAKDAALERTRKQVRMLDDLYKNAVVLITDKYVNKEDDYSAGSAAVALFAVMKKGGWHDARLLDATGEPYNEDNSPQDGFEKAAIEALQSGKTYYEEVVEIDGKPHLKAATPVPVVSQKCAICHPHYNNAKKGQPIGAIGYTLAIE